MRGFCPEFAVFVHQCGKTTGSSQFYNYSRFRKILLRSMYHFLRYLSVVSCKIFFQEEAVIGKNIWLSKKGNIIIGVDKIGNNCVIHHNVTFGLHLTDNESFKGNPRVGDRVWIGPDTIIHGNIKIGNGATILGGTVLTKTIPAHCVVSGNPGKILYRDFDNSGLLDSSRYEMSPQTIKEWTIKDA